MTRVSNPFDPQVAIAWGPRRYDAAPPFSPDPRPIEYPHADPDRPSARGDAYATVRESLRLLGLDASREGTREWNPLGGLIKPNDTVVLKPNLVRDFRESDPDPADCLTTHGSIIRAVVDYVHIALAGKGRIVIADAPHSDADFGALRRLTGLDEIEALYREHAGFEVEVYDLRPERARKIDGVIVGHEPLAGDPAGYVKVNLGLRSAFAEINHLCHLLYGSEYDMGELYSHQHDDVHEYLISKTVLEADVVIGLPKLKTHKKVGLTVNLKNLVGINGNKNWLPHHREGTPPQGGDQFADDSIKNRMERAALARFKRLYPMLGPLRGWVASPVKAIGKRIFGDTNVDTIRSGNWYGNDTAWRMVMDLNRILLYADPAGGLHDRPVRRFFTVVDGVVAGEGNGPLDPVPVPAGAVVAGWSPVAVDLACARLMGFDYRALPVLTRALDPHPLPLASFAFHDVRSRSNRPDFDGPVAAFKGPCLALKPHFGWQGHVELPLPNASNESGQPCVA